jgi:general secretion pathway protein C
VDGGGSDRCGRLPCVAVSAPGRAWSDRRVILDRNLFQVSTLLPAQPAAVPVELADEKLEATRLPLRLLGTVASIEADAAYAAVEDQRTRKKSVLRVGEGLLDEATVLRIERRRIVIQNGPKREELVLDDERSCSNRRRAPRASPPGPLADALRNQVQELSETSFAAPRDGEDPALRERAQSFAAARIQPRYEQGQMTGVQVASIDRGSLFEHLGIAEGDTVTQVNGIVVTGQQDGVAALRELSEASEFEVTVIGADGQARTLTHSLGTD